MKPMFNRVNEWDLKMVILGDRDSLGVLWLCIEEEDFGWELRMVSFYRHKFSDRSPSSGCSCAQSVDDYAARIIDSAFTR